MKDDIEDDKIFFKLDNNGLCLVDDKNKYRYVVGENGEVIVG